MARISTGKGDDGTTSLGTGGRVLKSSSRIAFVGALDETNDALGLAAAFATREPLRVMLRSLQADLFALGADATAGGPPRIGPAAIDRLVREEDRLEAALPPLTKFILPGGTPCAAHLHLARSLARRAERAGWGLAAVEEVDRNALVYLNRLSDLLFLLAREENVAAKVEETQWLGG